MALFHDTANNVTDRVVARPVLPHYLRAVKLMGQQIGSDSGALKFFLSVTSALLVAMILGAFTMTYFVTSHLASLETQVAAMSSAINYRLDRDEQQIDHNTNRLDGNRSP